jgi:hypothetical protein
VNVLVSDSHYMFFGNLIDTTAEGHSALLSGTLNLNGEVMAVNQFYSNDFDYHSNFDVNTELNDSIYVISVAGTYTDNDTLYSVLIWLNSEGDTIRMRKYFSPYYEPCADPNGISNWMTSTAICADPAGQNLYFASQIVDYPPGQNGFVVKKINDVGEEVWTYLYPVNDVYYITNTIQWYNDSLYLVAFGSGGDNYPKILNLNDENGTLNWSHEIDGGTFPIYGTRDFILEDDKIIGATKALNSNFEALPLIYKADLNGVYEWYTVLDGNYMTDNQNDHIAQAQDGGFVCCSEKKEHHVIGDEGNHESSIWLWKVDVNGQLQWERSYEYFTVDSGYWNLYNIARDFKATPDGGFICAGEATAMCTDYPDCDHSTQQGWLLKVDGCGCLVPGCDENCIVDVQENESTAQHYFKVGPNPASDDFYVYLSSLDLTNQQLELSCLDMNGKMIRTFPIRRSDTTFVIDVRSLPAGEYFLQLKSDVKVLQTERVLVVR